MAFNRPQTLLHSLCNYLFETPHITGSIDDSGSENNNSAINFRHIKLGARRHAITNYGDEFRFVSYAVGPCRLGVQLDARITQSADLDVIRMQR